MGLGLGGLQSGGTVNANSVIPALIGQDIVARSISLTQASGSVAVQLVGGARLDFGGTGTDYIDSDNNQTIRLSTHVSTLGDLVVGTGGTGDLSITRGFYRQAGARLLVGNTAPTIASGFGASPSIVVSNGSIAFTVNVGTGGVADTGVITFQAATTGWILHVNNLSNPAISVVGQTATTTTSASLQNYSRTTGLAAAWTASDILQIIAIPY